MLLADDASQKSLLSFQDVGEAGKEEQLSLTNMVILNKTYPTDIKSIVNLKNLQNQT